jgi:O-methyltransferase domain
VSGVSPQERCWNLLRGGLGTKAFGIAADLGVADALSSGPLPVAEIARQTGADEDTLYRILRALASDGVFAEHEPRVFRNTDASELLRSDHPERWRDYAHLFSSACFTAVGAMEARRGDTAFERSFGTDFWSWLAEHPEDRAGFDRAMSSDGSARGDRLAALEWRGDETVVDLGGGSGGLLRELLQRRPGLRGIVFDLPETNRDEASFGADLDFVAGSFFEQVPRADVYVLSKILHDWDDESSNQILQTVRAAAPRGARLLVLEDVVPPGNDPNGSKWLDLLMLILAQGRERTEPEWRALLEGAGLTIDRIEDGLIEARCR